MGSEQLQAEHIVIVAASRHSTSLQALKWTLSNKLVGQGGTLKLLHVRPPLLGIPNPDGSMVPIDQFRPEIVAAYMDSVQSGIKEELRSHKKLCDARKVQSELIIVESDNVAKCLVDNITGLKVNKFIIGTSTANSFIRKLKKDTISEFVLRNASESCSVHVVCNGKRICFREAIKSSASSESNCIGSDSTSDKTQAEHGRILRLQGGRSFASQPLTLQRERSASIINLKRGRSSVDIACSRNVSHYLSFEPIVGAFQEKPEYVRQSFADDHTNYSSSHEGERDACINISSSSVEINEGLMDSLIYGGSRVSEDGKTNELVLGTSADEEQIGEMLISSNISDKNPALQQDASNQKDEVFDLERLKLELEEARRRVMEAEHAAALAAQKAKDLDAFAKQEAKKREQALIVAQLARSEAAEEARRYDDVQIALEAAKLLAEQEAERRREAENRAKHEVLNRQKAMAALEQAKVKCREYQYEDLKAATDGFSESNRIGLGGYGPVYKGKLHHTTVAIKVLKQDSLQGPKEFQQEIDILSQLHHPHMVLLLGACPEKGCLVYEYLANGSLEDRLYCKGNTPPLPWHVRFRIAAEVAKALLFLHSSKPDPYVHRDIKPGNVLLDQNMHSKLGDVGLARLAPGVDYSITEYRETYPVGTFAYIDPEYQRTGVFTPRSDVYAFGLVLLQLLTAQVAVGLADSIENAVEKGRLAEVLDSAAGNWPISEALEMAKIGIWCSQMKRKDRPDLEKILPTLEKLRTLADDYAAQLIWSKQLVSESRRAVPSFFICPISKDVMEDPHIAADGFTYEYGSIKQWLQNNKTSPMTNLKLRHKQLTPNLSLRSAILEWKQKNMAFA